MDAAYNPVDGRGVGRPAYLAPCIIFPELGERLAAQAADHAARSELAERQAALDQVKAQVKVMQRALDEAQRNIAALQGILDKSLAILEASGRERLRGHGGRKHSGQPGGMSVPRRRRAAAEAAKRMRWVTKMQARADLAMDDFSG